MNIYRMLKRVLPDPPLVVGTITAIADGTAIITLPGGGQLQARGVGTVGDKVFVRDGAIEAEAPDLTIEVIEV